jgi:DNA-binding response OmpR family regulator
MSAESLSTTQPGTPSRILVIEDEAHLAAGLKLNLELEGYEVETARTLRETAALLVQESRYDLLILDVMLPDGDGFTLCKKLRAAGDYTPVIMLTARSSAEDRVRGLNTGADDYIAKPFELDELLARVRSALRRRSWESRETNSEPGRGVLEFGEARIDFDTHAATAFGKTVRLTQLELDLLHYFSCNPHRVLTREELLEQVWELRNSPNTRSIDNFIVRLRKYFEPRPNKPVFFRSHRGAGYKFVPEGSAPAESEADPS